MRQSKRKSGSVTATLSSNQFNQIGFFIALLLQKTFSIPSYLGWGPFYEPLWIVFVIYHNKKNKKKSTSSQPQDGGGADKKIYNNNNSPGIIYRQFDKCSFFKLIDYCHHCVIFEKL